jgi:hypothetical protein
MSEEMSEEQRRSASIANAISKFMSGTSQMCGEGFITHEEHQAITDIADEAAARYLAERKLLKDLDFEP